jgi:hypothetical protein
MTLKSDVLTRCRCPAYCPADPFGGPSVGVSENLSEGHFNEHVDGHKVRHPMDNGHVYGPSGRPTSERPTRNNVVLLTYSDDGFVMSCILVRCRRSSTVVIV